MTNLYEKFRFAQHRSLMYNALTISLIEAFNKALYDLLKMMASQYARDWHEKLGEVLWAYQTSCRMPTQSSPYA